MLVAVFELAVQEQVAIHKVVEVAGELVEVAGWTGKRPWQTSGEAHQMSEVASVCHYCLQLQGVDNSWPLVAQHCFQTLMATTLTQRNLPTLSKGCVDPV